MWVDIDWLSETPYYELIYFVQVLSLYHICISFFSCDNFLCLMSLHIATQFRILQYRLQNLTDLKALKMQDETSDKALLYYAEQCHETFKQCVRDHQALIIYCYTLETVFTEMALGQVLTSSALMCLQAYQLTQSGARIIRRMIYICFFMASLTQLLMFTYSCDHIIEESTNVGTAAYTGPWTHLPMNKYSKMLRNNMLVIMLRSKVPCCVTACGFFPVRLETYTTVLSTAMSYFTLLRNNVLQ
ncbi:odorant receptor 10-like isoform X2 [Andrena cerasifolii]|uniref:odorant receptor 10-like isoform X2 n=1 Tax=Andrena cerasifolii TaxID=2819439 RepID=UPI0040376620